MLSVVAALSQVHAQTEGGLIRQITVSGNERIEPATVASYLTVRVGDPFDPQRIDESLKSLFATGLFADVTIRRQGDVLSVAVVENPIINRIVFEGNQRLDNDELLEEVRLRPRVVYTRAKVRADVQRMLELYRRKGRFAAAIEPKIIQREQNRVDLVFEIAEGPKTKIARINFLGNERFSDGDLRDELATRESRWWRIFTSEDTYDPDRLAFDRELLRQFYLTRGYADFRVVSAVAELTPDRESFFITFTIEEGEIYEFGEVDVESQIRDIKAEDFRAFLLMEEGERYNAKKIQDTVDLLTNAAGVLGYAFVDVRPRIRRDREERRLHVTFRILEAPRVYVERIDIHGNVRTLDRVVRREFRLLEGDAFNSSRLRRSQDRIDRLGFFREVEVEQLPGSAPDRVIIDVSVQEQATGELSLGAGFSSLENFIFDLSVRERNLLGRGQDLRLGFTISSRRQQIDIGFTEPYFLGRNIAAGFDLFRRVIDNSIESSFDTTTLGAALRAGLPLAEFWSLGLRYTIRSDEVEIEGTNVSPFVLAAAGTTTTSAVGYSLVHDTLNNRLRPTRGQRFVFSQDFAGLGGDIRYLRSRIDYDKYWSLGWGFVLRFGAEGGFIDGIGQDVRINDRFFLGGPRIRGFDTAGIGPRDEVTDDALGGNAFYLSTLELNIPLGSAAEELGLQGGIFVDAGSLFEVDEGLVFFDIFGNPIVNPIVGDTPDPRLSVGVGFSWNSPFGPFRVDLARALRKNDADITETFQFNIGTRF